MTEPVFDANGWCSDMTDMPEGVAAMTKIDDADGERNVQPLVKRTREPDITRPMYWYSDGSMYIYYNPTHWKPL